MAHVQQIEVAVGERDALAGATPLPDAGAEIFATQDFALRVQELSAKS